MKPISLLIVDDDDVVVKLLERLARREKLSFAICKNGYEAIDFLTKNSVECVLLDIHLPTYSGFQVLEYIQSIKSGAEVIIMTGSGSVEQAVKALKQGAFDYLTKPFVDLEKVSSTIYHALERHRLVKKIHELEQTPAIGDSFQEMVGRSASMREIFSLIHSLNGSRSSVLIEGESGTGKEMIAKAIHRTSTRSQKPFLVINCAAIPEGLLESELFGHLKGSFTGALYDRRGLFEEANGGTLFLDEMGEISPAFQVKLLRVLQDGEFKRVGASEISHTDVRIIAATNRHLTEMVRNGSFREDLYYRLHVIGIHVPPLRDRPEDIPALVYHFLNKYNEKLGKKVREVSLDAMQALQTYPWVGNVRELENIIERCLVFTKGEVIRAKDLPASLLSKTFYIDGKKGSDEEDLSHLNYQDAKARAVLFFNKAYLSQLLKEMKGNISLASERAGMDRSNFKKILKKYEVDIREFKRG